MVAHSYSPHVPGYSGRAVYTCSTSYNMASTFAATVPGTCRTQTTRASAVPRAVALPRSIAVARPFRGSRSALKQQRLSISRQATMATQSSATLADRVRRCDRCAPVVSRDSNTCTILQFMDAAHRWRPMTRRLLSSRHDTCGSKCWELGGIFLSLALVAPAMNDDD